MTADADTSPRGDDDPARDDGDGRRAGRSQRRAGTGKRREPAGSDDQAADAGSTPPEGRLRKGGEAHERDVDASTSSERGEAAPQRDEPPAAEGGAAGDDGSDGSGRGGGKAGKRDRLGKLLVERKRKRNRDTGRQGEASEAAPDPTAEGQREGAGKADVPATDDGAGAVPAVPAAARTDRRETGAEAAEAAEAGDVPWPRADRRRSPPSGAPPRWPAAHEDAADDAPVAEPVDESAEGGRRRRRVLRSSEDVAREAADGGGRSGGSRALARVSRREANRSLAPVPEETGTAVTTREGRQGGRNLKARQKQEPAPQTLTERQTRRLALPAQATERTRRPWFARLLVASLVLLVLLPTAAVAAFYMFKASPQYASVSQFAVRGAAIADDAEVPSILSGAGPPSMPEIADSLILVDYVHSREVVDSLIENVDFLRLYSRPEIDFHYRLDPDQPIEEIVDYWRMMSTIEFDETSMIMSLTVRAFTPEDAERVADHVIRLSENLVNELSSRARTDSVKLAREEVALAEARFRNARTALAEFRDQEFEIDPTATATQRQTIVGTLESELASQEALLSALRSTMSEESPRVVYVKNQIEALRRQIAQQREDVARPEEGVAAAEPVLTRRLSRFEELEAERQFAQEAYTSSLAALETARIEAAKQQRYLAVFVPPAMPQEALYPEGLRWTIIVAGGLFLGWGISALIGAAVRDHMA